MVDFLTATVDVNNNRPCLKPLMRTNWVPGTVKKKIQFNFFAFCFFVYLRHFSCHTSEHAYVASYLLGFMNSQTLFNLLEP